MSELLHTTEADVQQEQLEVLRDLGWEVMSRKEMTQLRGPARMNEAIVEPLLAESILKLNEGLDEDDAREVAALVRRINSDRQMLEVLRTGVPYKPSPTEPTAFIQVVDTKDPSRNRYVATEEFTLRTGSQREPRLDVVCLVNGLPLGAIENKDTSEPLSRAADDWSGYWADAPQLIAQTSVIGCCNGLQFRVGPSGLQSENGYMEWSDVWPQQPADDPDDEMLVGLTGAFHPHTLVDLAANFILFETREGITVKKLARAHQFRAANKLVSRVVQGELDRGIVWHATGSGKSLTMVFAARKLLRSGLGNPTVLLVIDRTELDEQINETLTATEFDGVQHAKTRKRLAQLLGRSGGGVIVTTVQKFDAQMAALAVHGRVIAFVDEAHRTQFGKFGIWMRKALPTAALFAFTGTPIEQEGRSTRVAFSPVDEHGHAEPYLDRYGFDQAIADGATVPVAYEARLAEWRISRMDLDEAFDQLTEGLTDEERDALRKHAARETVIAKALARVEAVAGDVADQLKNRIAAGGLTGQLVGVDREACCLLANELSKHLKPEEYAVVMSRSKKDSARRPEQVDLREWYPSAHWERVHQRALDVDEGEADEDVELGAGADPDEFVSPSDRAAIKDFIKRFKNAEDPLKLLVVNAMLLTGFDAPIEQALFLDRGLRGHTLMQALARTNRRYPGKDTGLVLDYWGVFDDLQAALAEFATEDVAGLVEDTESLVARFPKLLDEALDVVSGAPQGSPRRRMLWVVRHLTDNPEEAARFEQLVGEAQSVFETLSPDPRLAPYIPRYSELLEVWAAWGRGTRRDRLGLGDFRLKTEKLVHDAIGMDRIRDDLPARTIDADFLHALAKATELTPAEKATDIEAAVVHETTVRGTDDPLARTLIERLARLRQQRSRTAQMTIEQLGEWEELVRDYVGERGQAADLGLDDIGAVVHAVLRRAAPTGGEREHLAVAQAISAHRTDIADFPGWSERSDLVSDLRRAVVAELVRHEGTRRLALDASVLDDLMAGMATTDREPS